MSPCGEQVIDQDDPFPCHSQGSLVDLVEFQQFLRAEAVTRGGMGCPRGSLLGDQISNIFGRFSAMKPIEDLLDPVILFRMVLGLGRRNGD